MAVQGTQYLAPTQSSLAKQRTAEDLPSPSKAPPPFSPSAVPGSPIAGAYEPLMQRVPSFAESLRCCQIHDTLTALAWLSAVSLLKSLKELCVLLVLRIDAHCTL